jgi:hypothetical protein
MEIPQGTRIVGHLVGIAEKAVDERAGSGSD